MKYAKVISDLSSSTYTAYSAAFSPPCPLRNFPGPKSINKNATLPNTEQHAAFSIAHNSRPTADAVIARYIISTMTDVSFGNYIFKELNPKPASIAAIPKPKYALNMSQRKGLHHT